MSDSLVLSSDLHQTIPSWHIQTTHRTPSWSPELPCYVHRHFPDPFSLRPLLKSSRLESQDDYYAVRHLLRSCLRIQGNEKMQPPHIFSQPLVSRGHSFFLSRPSKDFLCLHTQALSRQNSWHHPLSSFSQPLSSGTRESSSSDGLALHPSHCNSTRALHRATHVQVLRVFRV
ncbi:hypothetical protein LY78DRAFT_465686 [Colletotrichum sublineola]|nr:hypothetical protein LY78DRAFT_465686 [Colletotrichum sublineola]